MKNSLERMYPNIDRWVYEHQGWIEIGYDIESPLTSFIRALDCGGTMVEGKDEYDTLEEALQDIDLEIEAVLKEIYDD